MFVLVMIWEVVQLYWDLYRRLMMVMVTQ